MHSDQDVTTTYLGHYSREVANEIAAGLHEAGIVWWYKEPGFLSWVWEWGVRLFVDEARLDEAQTIAASVGSGSSDEEPPPDREA
jgi:hypothetical protein